MSQLDLLEHIRPLYCSIYSAEDGVAPLLCDPEDAKKFVDDYNEAFRLHIIYQAAQNKGVAFFWPADLKIRIRTGISDDPEWVYRHAEQTFYLPWPPPPPSDNQGLNHCTKFLDPEELEVQSLTLNEADDTVLTLIDGNKTDNISLSGPCGCKTCLC